MSDMTRTPDRPWLKRLPILIIFAVAVLGAVYLRDYLSFKALAENREALIAFAEKAKNGGNYGAANAAFALALHEHFPSIECSLSVRERPKTPTGAMTDGYYDLAYIQDGGEETCIPIPKLRGTVAYWFAAHADRREPIDHDRDTSGVGPTIADLETALGPATVGAAALAILDDDAVRERYEG